MGARQCNVDSYGNTGSYACLGGGAGTQIRGDTIPGNDSEQFAARKSDVRSAVVFPVNGCNGYRDRFAGNSKIQNLFATAVRKLMICQRDSQRIFAGIYGFIHDRSACDGNGYSIIRN